MFARIVSMPLKPNSATLFSKAIQEGVLPLLSKHKGFVDQITLVTSDGKLGYGISFWDTEKHAEEYQRTGFNEVMKALEIAMGGPTVVQLCKVTNSTAHHIAATRAA